MRYITQKAEGDGVSHVVENCAEEYAWDVILRDVVGNTPCGQCSVNAWV